jgi:hypothetical protein
MRERTTISSVGQDLEKIQSKPPCVESENKQKPAFRPDHENQISKYNTDGKPSISKKDKKSKGSNLTPAQKFEAAMMTIEDAENESDRYPDHDPLHKTESKTDDQKSKTHSNTNQSQKKNSRIFDDQDQTFGNLDNSTAKNFTLGSRSDSQPQKVTKPPGVEQPTQKSRSQSRTKLFHSPSKITPKPPKITPKASERLTELPPGAKNVKVNKIAGNYTQKIVVNEHQPNYVYRVIGDGPVKIKDTVVYNAKGEVNSDTGRFLGSCIVGPVREPQYGNGISGEIDKTLSIVRGGGGSGLNLGVGGNVGYGTEALVKGGEEKINDQAGVK